MKTAVVEAEGSLIFPSIPYAVFGRNTKGIKKPVETQVSHRLLSMYYIHVPAVYSNSNAPV